VITGSTAHEVVIESLANAGAADTRVMLQPAGNSSICQSFDEALFVSLLSTVRASERAELLLQLRQVVDSSKKKNP